MLHPSYVELMKVVNKNSDEIGEEPVVNSRYSIGLRYRKKSKTDHRRTRAADPRI